MTHAATREQALDAYTLHQRYPAEVQSCQACGDAHLAHYSSPGMRGCVACEPASRACPAFVPGPLPYPLAKHLDPVSEDPDPCPWLCGHEISGHGSGHGCLRCGCGYTGEPGTRPPGGTTYHGYPVSGPGGRLVVVIEAPAGTPVSLLPHVVRHSPTGMSWGYGGSGPADLARSLLIAALGPAAACPECRGTGKVTYDDTGLAVPCGALQDGESDPESVFPCAACEDGYRQLPHQAFKFAEVARWDQHAEWVISRAQILRWLEGADPGLHAAAIAALPEDA